MPDDYSASTSSTGRITAGTSASGNIETPGDRDWFAINLTAGNAYTFRQNGTSGLDSYLRVMNPSGSEVASDDDSGGYRNSLITYTPTASGTYYLAAGSYGSSTGAYTISATSNTTGGTSTSSSAFYVSNAVSVEDALPVGVNNVTENASSVQHNELVFNIILPEPVTQTSTFEYRLSFPSTSMNIIRPAENADISGSINGIALIAPGGKTARLAFNITNDQEGSEGIEYVQLQVNIQGQPASMTTANGYIVDNDYQLRDVQRIYNNTNLNNATDFASIDYDRNGHVHTGVDVNQAGAGEYMLPSPAFGVVTQVNNVSQTGDYGNVKVMLPSLFSPDGSTYFMTFLHATKTSLGSGQLVEPGSILGDFNPPNYGDHMHIEVRDQENGLAGWISSVSALASTRAFDPKPYVAIAKNMQAWQESMDTLPLGTFGLGSPHPNGVYSYMDSLSVLDSQDRLKFFLTEAKTVSVRLVWNDDGDSSRELNMQIVAASANTSSNGAGSWSPNGASSENSGEYLLQTYSLGPGEHIIQVAGNVSQSTPYWMNINFS